MISKILLKYFLAFNIYLYKKIRITKQVKDFSKYFIFNNIY
ncbi:hypothetical protein RC62_791 [Flavobacterium aquidurense]|uniref:Uncharacterized protein n=1 Tax=Flavobacterium aquidurense TaxID=362413 RepID=A0A0Q0S8X4_9FLAO|nr:hypothetical protein RC62_791 [Flavobacterium aquidurense]